MSGLRVTAAAKKGPVASVTVTPASATIGTNGTVQLTATLKDANGTTLTGRTVTWTSSNTGAATVSGSGLVTGVAVGSATITATSEGKSGTSAISVTNVPVATVTVSPASASVAVAQTVQLTAVLKDANGNTLTGRTVTWTSSNTAVATV
ncbi:MAG: Ig domain-containing protein, partial [Gemmatimonadetes bacterium]